MKSCFLFGHADCPDDILLRIEAAIEKIYVQREVSVFYVGDRGRFDSLAATAVKRVKLRHPDIQLHLLLAYHPGERTVNLTDGFDGSYYPPLEGVPRQYAIVRANKFMIGCADAFICYICISRTWFMAPRVAPSWKISCRTSGTRKSWCLSQRTRKRTVV